MSFTSWTYNGRELDLFPDFSKDGTRTIYLYDGVWDLVDVGVKKLKGNYACCENDYYFLDYRLVFKREPTFYINYMAVPVILLSGLSVTVFFLPPDMPSKLQFSITNLLALAVFEQLVADIIPPAATNSPLIDLYFQVMIIMVSLSVLATVIVVNISSRSREPIPGWFETLVLKCLSRVVCLHKFKMAEQVQHIEKVHVDVNDEEIRDTSLKDNSVKSFDSERFFESFHKSISSALPNMTSNDAKPVHQVHRREISLAEKWRVIALIVSRCFAVFFSVIMITCTTLIFVYIRVNSEIEFDNALGEEKQEWLRDTYVSFQ
ncbi:neuronal acetylcholine receptor subunit beta-3-like [Amphiura filiformis]|uniref:neuronal acetylcholine receptor subunit beta-3-like n=1 Tax=Amphiura filiformis TaxID=82378 RepID=UPI003B21A53F